MSSGIARGLECEHDSLIFQSHESSCGPVNNNCYSSLIAFLSKNSKIIIYLLQMSPDDQRDRESSRLLRTYEPFLDVILDSDDKETAFIQLIDAIRMTEVDDQWIPVNWVY